MALEVVEVVEDEKEVSFMSNADPKFVSLVRNGANRTPFQVIKSEDKGGVNVSTRNVVHSIIAAKGETLESIAAIQGNEWLADATKDDSGQFGEFTSYTQLSVEKFDDSTMALLQLEGGAGHVLVGALKADATGVENPLMISAAQAEKAEEMPKSPLSYTMDATEQMANAFKDQFYGELWDMEDAVTALLWQSATDPAARKAAVLAAIDGFRNFVELGLTAAGAEKIEVQKQEKPAKKADPTPAATPVEGGAAEKGESNDMGNDLFATKEEMATFITETVTAAAGPAVKAELAGILGGTAEKSEKTDLEKLTDTVTALAGTVEKMGEKLSGVAEKSEQLVTPPAGNDPAPESVTTARQPAEKAESTSVFAGMFEGAKGFDNSMGGIS